MNDRSIAFAELVAYAEGRLEGQACQAVAAYVAGSQQATARLARIIRVIETLRRDDTWAPTPRAVRGAVEAFAAWRRRTALPGTGRRFFAPLVHDSRSPSAHGAPRGVLSYTLAYEGEPARVELSLTATTSKASDPWRVRGEVAPLRGSILRAATLRTCAGHEPVTEADVCEGRSFRLEAPPGVYNLVLVLDQGVLILPHVEVGGPAARAGGERGPRPLDIGERATSPLHPAAPPVRP